MDEHRWGPLGLALAIAAGVVVGGILLSAAIWVLGMLAGIVFGLLRLAVLVGLAALVIWGLRFVFGERHTARY